MNCKPGDLAIIISCPDAPENVGMIVKVKTLYINHPKHGWTWSCSSNHPLGSFGYKNHYRASTHIAIPDSWLKPIRDNQKEDSEVKEKELTV